MMIKYYQANRKMLYAVSIILLFATYFYYGIYRFVCGNSYLYHEHNNALLLNGLFSGAVYVIHVLYIPCQLVLIILEAKYSAVKNKKSSGIVFPMIMIALFILMFVLDPYNILTWFID